MQKTTTFNFIEGEILLFDKPIGWTSFDLVHKIRNSIKKYIGGKTKIKVGHTGTLDPLASGLLIICSGKATKKIDTFQNLDKEYTGIIFLGATTASYDLESDPENVKEISHLSEIQILETAKLPENCNNYHLFFQH
jgi:tRNA pseudouridine55 synthase